MKRVLALILAAIMCLSLAACDNKAEEKEETKKTESAQIEVGSEFKASGTTLKLTRVYKNEDYSYYSDSACVEMLFDITNNSNDDVSPYDIITLEATVSGEKYTDASYILTNNTKGYDAYEILAAGASAKLIARIYLPTEQNEVALRIKADKAKYVYNYTLGNDDKIVTPLAFNTAFTVDGVGEFTITKSEATASVRPIMSGSYYYSPSPGNVYIDTIFSFTSSASDPVSSSDILTVTAKGDSGSTYTDYSVFVETSNGTNLSSYESITPLSTVRLHAAVSVSETETTGTLEFNIGGNFYAFDFDASQKLTTASALNVGNVIGTDNTAKAEFLSYEFVDAVYPSVTNEYYTYSYKVGDTNSTYLALAFNITNYGGSEIVVTDAIYATAKFADKYTYTGFAISETDDKTSLSSYQYLKPLETGKVFFLITVPKTVTSESYEVTVAFDGVEYVLSVTA